MESLKATAPPREQKTSRNVWTVLAGVLVSLRPHQWVKNILVFAGLIFSNSLFQDNHLQTAAEAFVVFCLASSGIYLFNDLRDQAADRAHPVRRHRPLASGQISEIAALVTMILLLLGAVLASHRLGLGFSTVVGIYVLLNAGYSFGLKQVVILDVIIVAMGFVLRAVAGAVVINVEPSAWLILCTLMLALMVVSGKRRYDLILAETRPELAHTGKDWYTIEFLDLMTAISGGAAIVTYALYTQAPETVTRFNTRGLILTVPFVLYGVLRYLFLSRRSATAADPAKLMLTDRPTLLNSLLWGIMVCLALYGAPLWEWIRHLTGD